MFFAIDVSLSVFSVRKVDRNRAKSARGCAGGAPDAGSTGLGEPLEWLGAAPIRVLDDFNRRQGDGLPFARARGTAADVRAAAAQERQRHDAVVCARQAVGIARSGTRGFSTPEADAIRATRSPEPPSRRGGAARCRLASRRCAQGSQGSIQEKESPRARVVGEGSGDAARSRQARIRCTATPCEPIGRATASVTR
jgi:hypothetical protein